MKRAFVATVSCALGAAAALVLAQHAASQPRITTTRQLQVIGATSNNQGHGAWLVDLQSNSIIFCERAGAATQCHTTTIP